MRSDMTEEVQQDVSRRGFLKGALLGGAALTMSSKLALAEQMMAGRLTAKDIHGVGMKPGRVEMSLNENPVGPSPRALRAIADNMFDINRYVNSFSGSGQTALIEALAEYDGVELPKKGPSPDMMMMEPPPPQEGQRQRQPRSDADMMKMMKMFLESQRTPYFMSYGGSGHILNLLALAYLSKGGGEVIEAEMGYQDITRTAQIYNLMEIPTNVIHVPMTKDYRHDLDAMLKAITPKTTMVVITNPNNPTGTLMSYVELERFVNAVPKTVVILIDEAYIHFVRDPNYTRAIPLAIANDNVIVTRTFSKVYGMPAMRLGYAVCSAAIQQKIEFYGSMFNFIPLLTMVAGTAAVKDMDHVRRSQQTVWDFRDSCYQTFDEIGLEYIPSEGNFFMVNVGRDGGQFAREMFKRRVKVTARSREKMPTWIRVSAGSARETEVFLNEFKDIMSKQG